MTGKKGVYTLHSKMNGGLEEEMGGDGSGGNGFQWHTHTLTQNHLGLDILLMVNAHIL
jgi:hypothetical protein